MRFWRRTIEFRGAVSIVAAQKQNRGRFPVPGLTRLYST
jgi:hypothetical protein